MATDIRYLPATFNDDATFRQWGRGISEQIAAMGLVRTSDTGQIDWATVLKPASTAFAGYEMWRFDDALQATAPVFIKLEYGANAGNRPYLRPQVGQGTSGTGIVGTAYGNAQTISAPLVWPYPLLSYCSGSKSRLSLATNYNGIVTGSSYTFVILIERVKLPNGSDTDDAILTLLSTNQWQIIPLPTEMAVRNTTTQKLSMSLQSGGKALVGMNCAMSPVLVPIGEMRFASWCVYDRSVIGQQVPFQASHLGATRTFLPLGVGISGSALSVGAQTNVDGMLPFSIAMAWD